MGKQAGSTTCAQDKDTRGRVEVQVHLFFVEAVRWLLSVPAFTTEMTSQDNFASSKTRQDKPWFGKVRYLRNARLLLSYNRLLHERDKKLSL